MMSKVLTVMLLTLMLCVFGAAQPQATHADLYSITQITNTAFRNESPYINNNGTIVWSGSNGTNYDIFMYNKGTVSRLTNGRYDNRNPQINNSGTVVWDGFDGSASRIYTFDGQQTRELTHQYDSKWPQMNTAGDVVWHTFDGTTYDVYRYLSNTGSTDKITGSAPWNEQPAINSSGQLSWQQWDGHDYEMMLYNNGRISQITNNSWDDLGLKHQLNDQGQIAWYGFPGGSNYYGEAKAQIFFYDGKDLNQLTDDPLMGSYNPAINNRGEAVWTADDGNVYVYSHNVLSKLSVGGYFASEAIINDNGDIVWYGEDSSGKRQIFLANPVPVPPTFFLFIPGLIGFAVARKRLKG